MLDIIWGSTDKPVSSKQLADKLEELNIGGTLYIGYPIIGSSDGPFPIEAMLVSSEKGVVIFHLVEGHNLGNYQEKQDESFTKFQAKLLQHKQLLVGRELKVKISVVTFSPLLKDIPDENFSEYPICNLTTIQIFLDQIQWGNNNLFSSLIAVIQSISNIRKTKKRRQLKIAESRGSKLKKLEESISNLDNIQSEAVIQTVNGVQRIRGLAGSGKTIVLALKVAYLHAQHPDWKIIVTFNTRSLKGQFERLINSFTMEQTGDEPDWENIEIINAWGKPGGKNADGVYHKFCKLNGLEFLSFMDARTAFPSNKEFDGVCEKALKEVKNIQQVYDLIIVDEAQDFGSSFLRLCFEMLKEPKRLIYAYDELQSLTNSSLPSPEIIFGKNLDESPRVRFEAPVPGSPKQDIILNVCYRNSRPLLTTAHALGFGIYREPEGLIQMFDQKVLWEEVGYTVLEGQLNEGERVVLGRTHENSPAFLESHSPIDDLIQFQLFDNNDDQINWLVAEITNNIRNEELEPDDIIVINPDPLTTKDVVGIAREKLFANGINNNLAGVSTGPDIFYEQGAVTFTGIFRAKGNEAAMVYIINAQDCFTAFRGDLARVRNRLFTAITRSKAWVRVCGFGPDMSELKSEFLRLKSKGFKLDFTYPTAQQRLDLNIINRDMSEEEKKRIDQKKIVLKSILESLVSGETIIDDYSDEVIQGLKQFLDKRKK